MRSTRNWFELHSSYSDEDSALAVSSNFTKAEGTLWAFHCLHLHDSALALCRAVSFTFVWSTHNFFEVHSSYLFGGFTIASNMVLISKCNNWTIELGVSGQFVGFTWKEKSCLLQSTILFVLPWMIFLANLWLNRKFRSRLRKVTCVPFSRCMHDLQVSSHSHKFFSWKSQLPGPRS